MNRTFFAPALFAALFCLTAILPRAALASDYRTSMEVAQGDFESGEFENALSELQNALQATDDHRALCAVHLMRARCYSGLGDTGKMKDAFVAALEHDPMAELDPDEVSPSLIDVLEDLKSTLKAEISIRTNQPGALVLLDGRNIGVAPLRTSVPIGQHEFELRDPGGVLSARQQVLIRARQEHNLYIPLEEKQDDSDDFLSLAESSDSDEEDDRPDVEADAMRSVSGEQSGGRRAYFLLDLRYSLGGAFGGAPEGVSLDSDLRPVGAELGIGVSGRDLLAMVSGTFDGSTWGTTVKFGFRLDRLVAILGVQGSIDIPMVFPHGDFYLGAGASVGLNLTPIHFLDIFVEGSYRYFFVTPSSEKLIENERMFFGNNLWGVSIGLRFFI